MGFFRKTHTICTCFQPPLRASWGYLPVCSLLRGYRFLPGLFHFSLFYMSATSGDQSPIPLPAFGQLIYSIVTSLNTSYLLLRVPVCRLISYVHSRTAVLWHGQIDGNVKGISVKMSMFGVGRFLKMSVMIYPVLSGWICMDHSIGDLIAVYRWKHPCCSYGLWLFCKLHLCGCCSPILLCLWQWPTALLCLPNTCPHCPLWLSEAPPSFAILDNPSPWSYSSSGI